MCPCLLGHFRWPKSFFLLLLLGSSLRAQSTASIEGQVTDQNGAAIPAVEIVTTNAETGLKRATTTDAAGSYEINALPVGEYRLH